MNKKTKYFLMYFNNYLKPKHECESILNGI